MASSLGRHFCSYLYTCAFTILRNVITQIAELEKQPICVYLESGIKETEYALCCQSNEALEKTEVGPYHKHEDI